MTSFRIAHHSDTKLPETAYAPEVATASRWFAEHVTLFGQPYTLDPDQVRAASTLTAILSSPRVLAPGRLASSSRKSPILSPISSPASTKF